MKRRQILLLGMVGLIFILLGIGFLLGFLSLPEEGDLSCKAICGWGLIFTSIFGQKFGGVVSGGILILIGLYVCSISYLKHKKIKKYIRFRNL